MSYQMTNEPGPIFPFAIGRKIQPSYESISSVFTDCIVSAPETDKFNPNIFGAEKFTPPVIGAEMFSGARVFQNTG